MLITNHSCWMLKSLLHKCRSCNENARKICLPKRESAPIALCNVLFLHDSATFFVFANKLQNLRENRGFLNLLKMSASVVCVLRAVSQPITCFELKNKTCFCLRLMILTQIMTDEKKQQRFIRNEKC